jgi:murein DD-endopeptidase MepM/ murein hydrolase activator NlpD
MPLITYAAAALAVPLLLAVPLRAASSPAGGRSSPVEARPAGTTAAVAARDPTGTPAVPSSGRTNYPVKVLMAGTGAAAPERPPPGRTAGDGVVSWSWPLRPRPVVVRGFWIGAYRWSPGHRGVDLAAAPGAPVLAPADGTVRYAGELAGRPLVSLDHGHGVLSSFEPVGPSVRPGEPVRRGQVIGHLEAGHSHCAPGSCLHWGVREGGQYVDPLTLPGIWRGQVILLPLGTAG